MENRSLSSRAPDAEMVWAHLKTVYDPEIPINIVDLGLIYSCDVVEIEGRKWRAEIVMTLTTPACGMGPVIQAEVREKAESVAGVAEACVALVWEPPWSQEMISEEGRMQLGLV